MNQDHPSADRSGRQEVVRRRWKYAPPPWVIYEAVVGESARWLSVLPGETAPAVSDSRRPDYGVLEPWLDTALSDLEVRIEADGPGSVVTLVGHAEQDPDTRRGSATGWAWPSGQSFGSGWINHTGDLSSRPPHTRRGRHPTTAADLRSTQ